MGPAIMALNQQSHLIHHRELALSSKETQPCRDSDHLKIGATTLPSGMPIGAATATWR